MSDLDFREALNDLADEVILTDLMPRVQHRLTVRRRRRVVSAGVATLLILGGTVAAVGSVRGGHSRPLPPTETPTPSPAPTAANATTSVYPTWLPEGVTYAGYETMQPTSGLNPQNYVLAIAHSWYSIDGPANARTIPPGGITAQNATTVHPATTVDITFNPNTTNMPPVPADPAFFLRDTVRINGNRGVASTPKNGYGAFRIDWVDAAGYHSVMCDRLKTPEGRSGLPMDDLLHIARSLYQADDGQVTSNETSPMALAFTVGYLPSGFQPVVDEDAAGPPPAGVSRQAFQTDGSGSTRRSLSVDVVHSDVISDVATFAAQNGHLELTQIGGHPGAVGWNVPGRKHLGLHLAYVVVRQGVSVQVTEVDGRDAPPLSDDELTRVAAGVQLS
jgi:hypothetical protein